MSTTKIHENARLTIERVNDPGHRALGEEPRRFFRTIIWATHDGQRRIDATREFKSRAAAVNFARRWGVL
jgi:hypothetical protein